MGCRWNPIGFQFSCFMFLIITLQSRSSFSLNSERFVLLKFRARVDSDPHGTLANWNESDDNVCPWFGVTCVDNKVQILNLSGYSLGGTLAPELTQLTELRSLILSKNHLSGEIPKDFGTFEKLEFLDLRDNKLTGVVPPQLNKVLSPEKLLLSGNKFAGFITTKFLRLQSLYKQVQLNKNKELFASSAAVLDCVNRKLGYCVSRKSLLSLNKAEAIILQIKATSQKYMKAFPLLRSESHGKNYVADYHPPKKESGVSKRRELLEGTSNLAAMLAPNASIPPSLDVITEAFPRSSGSFPALTTAKKRLPPLLPPPLPLPPADENNDNTNSNDSSLKSEGNSKGFNDVWLYVIIGIAVFVATLVIVLTIFVCRKKAVKSIGPWKTGLSGQLQKAFVTGVPKLNRSELETACEDFSNIIDTFDGFTVYKGTLSSGVEIAVASTAIMETKEWTRAMEMAYRRKIDLLSRINHKNFVNLIGHCEEAEPFDRMMVFEYAPNGTLFEHLQDKEMEHLDWSSRMRIIMGTAYCLQYMHELNPPIIHSKLCSKVIFLTDDYAAKVAESPFNSQTGIKPRKAMSGDLDQSLVPLLLEPETNVYSFGILMLEIISGKLTDSDEDGSILQWASKYLENDHLKDMIDPTLKTFKEEELRVICDVVRDCVRTEESQRPTMKDVVEQLKQVTKISQERATPRLSPLWWAELEILSSEAT